MFLSIIIPVYKVESYLCECLDSIASSPLDCWEAILVDDGSPDGCPQICDDYARRDRRFTVIHQQNGGVSAARNAGLDMARGEWIWFVDSDDVADMRQVEWMLQWLQEHQEADLVMFDLKNFTDGTSPISASTGAEVPMVVDECLSKNDFLMKHICYHHPRLWYRRGCVDHHQRPLRFTCGIRLAEDLEFQYKYLTRCQRPVRMLALLYHYRLREGSATGDATYRERAVEDLPVVLRNMADWTKDNGIIVEPWYDYRIMKLLQNLIYSASLVSHLNIKEFQHTVSDIVSTYRALGFSFVRNVKIKLADISVSLYFFISRIYLKNKSINR